MARAALKLGVRELAELSQVSSMTISRFENGQSGGQAETLRKIQSAFELMGVTFMKTIEGDIGIMLRLKKSGQ